MKKTILLAVALMLSAITFAQPQLATLNHNNNITAFYGSNALVQAHAAAVAGDIITLSSGVFNATNITKPVTIRGAGAWADSTGEATMIHNGLAIHIDNNGSSHLIIEGICFPYSVTLSLVNNAQFIKCYFQWVGVNWSSYGNAVANHTIFTNCIISHWNSQHTNGSNLHPASGTQFINSVVLNCNVYTINDTYINCVVKQNPENAGSRFFQNCVLYWDYQGGATPSNNSNTSFNCLFVQMDADSGFASELYAPSLGHTLWNMRGMSNVFSSFNGGTQGDDFNLLPSVANTHLGTDGTQIGIYGGAMPFDPQVTNPLIRRVSVAPRSTPTGQLSVDIEVVNE